MEPETVEQQLCDICGEPADSCVCATVKVELKNKVDGSPVKKTMELAQSLTASLPAIGSLGGEGRYRFLGKIGTGGMGTVFRAEHVVLHRQVAIKILRSELLSDSQAMARFEQEARACAGLSHPNLVAIYDCGINESGQPYLIMEFLSGKSLSDVMKESGPLPISRFLDVFIDVANALMYAHLHGVIHRDLKPSNIILNDDPLQGVVPKIVDFGVAKIEDLGGEFQMLTSVGDVFGSPAYMSPEQCQGNVVDQRSDIYSLGCVMYEMVTGKQAFRGADIMTIMNKQIQEYPPPPVMADSRAVPSELQKIIMRCLRKDPAERFQFMEELKIELEKLRYQRLANQPVRIGALKIPHLVLPILVSLAAIACIIYFPSLMPGRSIQNWAGSRSTTSRAMLASYADRVGLEDYAFDTYRSLLTGNNADKANISDRLAIAVVLMDKLYVNGEYKEILTLYGGPISDLLSDLDNQFESDPKAIRQAAWCAPLTYFYAGSSQENQEVKNFPDAIRKYLDGIRLSEKLQSPLWVKAKLKEELGEAYMKLSPPQAQKAIPPLKDAIALLNKERGIILDGRRSAFETTCNLLFNAYNTVGNREEAAKVLESEIEFERTRKKPNQQQLFRYMRKLVRYSKKENMPDLTARWEEEIKTLGVQTKGIHREEVATKLEEASPLVLTERAYQYSADSRPRYVLAFNHALDEAIAKRSPAQDQLAIAAIALEIYSESTLVKEAETIYAKIEPALADMKKQQAEEDNGGFTGSAASVYYHLARTEYRANKLDKAEKFIELGRPLCTGQPDAAWNSARLEALLARIWTDQGRRLDEAEILLKDALDKMVRSSSWNNFRVADVHWTLAKTYDRKREYSLARAQVQAAIAAVDKDPWQTWRIDFEYLPELKRIERHEKGLDLNK